MYYSIFVLISVIIYINNINSFGLNCKGINIKEYRFFSLYNYDITNNLFGIFDIENDTKKEKLINDLKSEIKELEDNFNGEIYEKNDIQKLEEEIEELKEKIKFLKEIKYIF